MLISPTDVRKAEMRSSRPAPPPDGAYLIARWLRHLHDGDDLRFVWAALDHDLRLATAQAFLMRTGSRTGDDERGTALAMTAPTDPDFPAMAAARTGHWRAELAPLTQGVAFPLRPHPVGADMELWQALPTSPPAAGEPLRTYPFLLRQRPSGPLIAAVGRDLPLPGWPPSTWAIPHLDKTT